MIVLLDKDVLIEVLRGSTPARMWLGGVGSQDFCVPGVVATELVAGCRNAPEIVGIREFLGSFKVVWPEAVESSMAFDLFCEYRLTSGLGIPDCLIAAMSLERGAKLFSFNLKHFRVVRGLNVDQPYVREPLG